EHVDMENDVTVDNEPIVEIVSSIPIEENASSDLKAKLKAAVGQVVVNDEHSLHGPAHETQIVDLVRSEKGDQGSPEVPPTLSGNPSEAQIHDKPLHEMSPVVVPTEVVIISDDDSDRESIGSHSSENQTADAMVKSEPITNHPAIEHVDMENDVTVDNEPIVEIVSSIPIEENASSDLKAKLKAAVGQVVVNDEHSLHGPAHETQIVDLVRSEKGDQGSPEVPPALSGNPSEAQIHDKPLHEMSPVVVPTEVVIISDDDSDRESIGSHSSENQTADAMVKSEPITNHPAIEHVDMENDVTVDNEPIVEIVSSIPIEENASSDLKAKLKAAVGQVVVNDEHSLHGPAHETQIVDLVRREKGDQGSPEVPPALSGNPSEAQIHDKPLHEMSPVVVPTEVVIISDDDSDRESIGSHSSENQTADAMVKSEPITNHPAIEHVDMENDVTVDNEPIVEIVSS
ncbi:hypothetical protein Tco_1566242, partial [Tanacetum coccineum]